MNSLKALHVIPSISPKRGGPSTAVLAMVDALREVSVDAAILTTNDHGPDQDLGIKTGHWIEWNGVPIIAFPRWRPPCRAVREYAFSPALNIWLASHIHNYDLLHIHAVFSYPSTSAMAQARLQRIPYIVRSIGQLSPWSLSQSAGRKQLMMKLIERRNINAARAIHFTSTAERDESLPLRLKPKSLVIPLGVPYFNAQLNLTQSSNSIVRFLFLSRIHPKKQLDKLLQALALVKNHHPEYRWQLRIAGSCDSTYATLLQNQAAKLGLTNNCQWLGFLQGDNKWRELQNADWFVLPSAAENFGISVVEAMAAGTPVVISPHVAIAATVEQAQAGIITPSDFASLSNALLKAMNSSSESMGLAARTLARQIYSWTSIATKLKSSYLDIARASN